MEKPIIGIDLGTSTSEIAVLKKGQPVLLEDENGDRIVPSVVQAHPDGRIIVGSTARNTAVTYGAAQEVKRLMGTDQTVRLGDREWSPEAVSAEILKHLKKAAERKYGEGSVRDVVITVPARFENPAREATKVAAEMAGLNVLRLINEPTAAALSYGLDHLEDEKKVLVFDFGGGTLDVTVLEMFEGILDVKTSVGDDRLGGKDIDDLLIAIFAVWYKEQHGADMPDDPNDRWRLKEAAERCKKQLSTLYAVDVDILLTSGAISGKTLTRSEFEAAMSPLLERAFAVVDEALKRAKTTWAEIDVILPVGGSSRIPAIRHELERRWGKPLQEYDNPDEAVARGAAVAAGIETHQFPEDGIMILDVAPHRLGIRVVEQVGEGQYINDYFSEIIAKDAKLPAIQNRIYSTIFDGQESIMVRIYEATTESNMCQDHRMIGEMELTNLPKATAGQPIDIEFRYTLDGTLAARAHCVHAPDVKIEGKFAILGRPLDQEPLTVPESSFRLEDLLEASPDAKRCQPILEQAEKVEREHPMAAPRIRAAADRLRLALSGGNSREITEELDALTDLLYEFS